MRKNALIMLLLGLLGAASPTWAGTALTGNTGLACNATYAGYIRYNSGILEVCNGANWVKLSRRGAKITDSIANVSAHEPGCSKTAMENCYSGVAGACWVIQSCLTACSRYCLAGGYSGGNISEVDAINISCDCNG